MILRLPRSFIFPLATAAFAAVTVRYLNIIFTTSTRWVFLSLLVLYLLLKGRFLFGLQSRFGAVLLAYCTWCAMTSLWSEVPELSITKSIALVFVAVAFLSAGQLWVHERGSMHAMDYLAPMAAIVLLAVVGGGAHAIDLEAGGIGGQLELYQGLAGNPNTLGILIVSILPLLLWYAFRNRMHPRKKWIWIALVCVATVFLVRSHGRAAFLAAGIVAMGFCLPLKLPRTTFILVLIAGSLVVAVAVGTPLLDIIYQDYFLKGATQEYVAQYSKGASEGGFFYSRQGPWQASWDAAEQGGLFGAGYGVTVGDTSFQGGLTAQTYGREKGNTQLAIVEETGFVGLGLYLLLLVALFTRLVSAYRREKTTDMKIALGIVTGGLAGFTVEGLVEAWWVAPGSAETVYFWGLAGVALGLAQSSARSSADAPETVVARETAPKMALRQVRFIPQRGAKAD